MTAKNNKTKEPQTVEEQPALKEESKVRSFDELPVFAGGTPLPEKEAKQLAYTVRVILTSLKGDGFYEGDVPGAYDVRMFADGSVILRSFVMPQGVVMADAISLPAPINMSQLDLGRNPSIRFPAGTDELEARKQARRKPDGVPAFEGVTRRTIESQDGNVEVYD